MSLAVATRRGVESTSSDSLPRTPQLTDSTARMTQRPFTSGQGAGALACHQGRLLRLEVWRRIGAAAPDKMAFVIRKDAAGNLTSSIRSDRVHNSIADFLAGATHVASATVDTSNFFGASPITGNKLPCHMGVRVLSRRIGRSCPSANNSSSSTLRSPSFLTAAHWR